MGDDFAHSIFYIIEMCNLKFIFVLKKYFNNFLS